VRKIERQAYWFCFQFRQYRIMVANLQYCLLTMPTNGNGATARISRPWVWARGRSGRVNGAMKHRLILSDAAAAAAAASQRLMLTSFIGACMLAAQCSSYLVSLQCSSAGCCVLATDRGPAAHEMTPTQRWRRNSSVSAACRIRTSPRQRLNVWSSSYLNGSR